MNKLLGSQNFEKLLSYLHSNENMILKLVFANGDIVNSVYDTDYDGDNELEEDDPNFEELWFIIMKNIDTNKLFEFNYHNMPVEVYCGDKRII